VQSVKVHAALVLVLFALTVQGSANPIAVPEPLSASTRGELIATLRGPTGPELYQALQQLALLGPEYTWLLEELARRDDLDPMLSGVALDGLSANGDSASVSVLLDVAADTARTEWARMRAIEALGKSRFRDVIPSLDEMADGTSSKAIRDRIESAILRIRQPGRFRKLFTYKEGYVRFGFLLDDLKRVEFRRSTLDDSPIVFSTEQVKQICDELQAGERVEPYTIGMISDDGAITFVLRDGSSARLSVGGELFLADGLVVRSPSLARYLGDALMQGAGEPPN
jgi:hypothetical protein